MNVAFTLRLAELERIILAAAPLRIDLSNAEVGKRVIDIESVSRVELVAGEGIRIVGAGKITWPVLGLNVPVTLDKASVKLLPHAEATANGALSLRLRILIESADVPMIPEFAEISVIKKVNDALVTSPPILDFDLRKLVNQHAALPDSFEPKTIFSSHLTSLDLAITYTEVHLSAVIGADLEREPVGPFAPPMSSDEDDLLRT